MATADFRDRLLQCLGGDWPASPPLNVRMRETIQREGFTVHSVFYDAEPNDYIPAMLLIPDGVTPEKPAPAVAV